MPRLPLEQSQARALAELIRKSQAVILSRWRERVRQLPAARNLSEPLLIDEVGELVGELAEHLEMAARTGRRPQAERREAQAAASHGVERLRVGFAIDEVVWEYNLLRALIIEVAARQMPLAPALIGFINDVIDRSVGAAVKTYAHRRELEERRRRAEHIAFITHEMRNPLAALSAVVEVVRTGGQAPAPSAGQILQQSLSRLDALIRRLLEESRQITVDLRCENRPRRMRLRALVEAICGDVAEPARRAGLALHNQVPEGLDVYADASMLDVVIANLVKNGIDHSGAANLIVGACIAGEQVLCWVEDDGRGLVPEQRGAIFEPYQPHGSTGGSGLGLHIAKRFTEAMGGRIAVHCDGRGVRFELRLPAGA